MKPFYSHFLLPALVLLPAVAAGTWALAILFEDSNSIMFEDQRVSDFTVEVRLAAAPAYDSEDYFGTGTPYLLVTVHSPNGGLHEALLEGDATAQDFTGYDACATRFVFRDFRIIAPVGGASNQSTNVTYSSESYGAPFDLAPGGRRCAARFGVESVWAVDVRIEFDGIKSDPEPGGGDVQVDGWDFNRSCLLRGSASG